MSVKLLTEHNLEFLSLKGGCTGSSESTLVKMPHCWKSHVMAHIWFGPEPRTCILMENVQQPIDCETATKYSAILLVKFR